MCDDEVVEGRARDAVRSRERARTDVMNKGTVDAEHAHAVVAVVGDNDVAVAGHEAQSLRVAQLAVAAAFASEPTKKSAVTPVEQSDAVGVVAL
jgi:hypothetical protein